MAAVDLTCVLLFRIEDSDGGHDDDDHGKVDTDDAFQKCVLIGKCDVASSNKSAASPTLGVFGASPNCKHW